MTAIAIATVAAAASLPIILMINSPNFPFIFLFIFRYLRLIVHIISFWLYKPTPVPANPTIHPSDCTVIISTVDPTNADFEECLQSVLANKPGGIIVVTVGKENRAAARAAARRHSPYIRVSSITQANKRHQVSHAIPTVHTAITILVDDHVFWPSADFLPTLLAPFENPLIGAVGTNKRVRRDTNPLFTAPNFWNFIGCIYLERHNFEITATNNIDGGVFVVSGRTSAHRTSILQSPSFLPGFKNERFFFNLFGPLNADDDNYITRYEVSHGWKIAIQNAPNATIETTLGTYPKFLSQCLRWVRTTWRSNPASLFTDRTVWRTQPWCVYAVYLTSFVNFALFYDAALVYTLIETDFFSTNSLCLLAAWILASKTVKLIPHFLRHPADVLYFPFYVAFAYFHSLIKLYAGLTFWVTAWGGRVLTDADADEGDDGDDDNDTPPSGADHGHNGHGGGDDDDGGSGHSSSSPTTLNETVDTSWGPTTVHRKRGPTVYSTPANVRESTYSSSYSRTSPERVWRQRQANHEKQNQNQAGLFAGDGDGEDYGYGYDYPIPPPSDVHVQAKTKQKGTWINPPVERVWWRGEECERLHVQDVVSRYSADEGLCHL